MVCYDSPVITGHLFLPVLQVLRKISFQELPFLKQTNSPCLQLHYMAVLSTGSQKGGKLGISFTDRPLYVSTANGTPFVKVLTALFPTWQKYHASHCAVFPDPLD